MFHNTMGGGEKKQISFIAIDLKLQESVMKNKGKSTHFISNGCLY